MLPVPRLFPGYMLASVFMLPIFAVSCSGSESMENPNLPSDIKNPLPDCPSTPNCVRYSFIAERDIDTVFKDVSNTLKDMDAHSIEKQKSEWKIESVFRIPVFGFKDDVVIKLEPYQSQKTVIHVRSASRVGKSDLGVNERRVRRFLKHFENKTSS